MRLWLPWNGDIGLIERYKNTDVVGFFGSCPAISPSARETSVLQTSMEASFCAAIVQMHKEGFEFAYTYNSIVDLDTTEMMDILSGIEALRPDRVVFASPQPMILAQDMKPRPEFEVSTIAEIINPSQCVEWAKIGAAKFTLSTRLSRFPEIIKRDFADFDVKILVNEICNLNCIFRKTHYINQSRDIIYDKYPHNHCQKLMLQNFPEQMLKNSWVLPSQLKNYSDNVEFKIVGRTQASWRIKQWVDYYLNERDPMDIMDILPWGKAGGDKTAHAGVDPIKGKQPELLKSKISEVFWNGFKESVKPCYAEDCEECGFCSSIAKSYTQSVALEQAEHSRDSSAIPENRKRLE